MNLIELNGEYSVCRLEPNAKIPSWVSSGAFMSITHTDEELSIVCDAKSVPNGIQSEEGWSLFRVVGPLDFSLTGILAQLAQPLAEAEISIFAISTFDTDYLLVKSETLEKAKAVLTASGHSFK